MAVTIGDYLKRWRERVTRMSIEKVRLRAKKFPDPTDGKALTRKRIERIEAGDDVTPKENAYDLAYVAFAYDADPAVLLFFQQIRASGEVVLNSGDFQMSPAMVRSDADGTGQYKATYRVAQRRLQPGNTMMAYLELEPGGYSRKVGHKHDGQEIIKVETGAVTFFMAIGPGDAAPQQLNKGDVIHFDSPIHISSAMVRRQKTSAGVR